MKTTIPCILVVDDEQAVRDLLVYNLKKAHYEVLTASDGQQALQLARQSEPDLVLLDLMLPLIDGLDVCRALRRSSRVPVIMITARGEEVDRVVGLELGADDYVVKPFSVRELMARIKAVLRRSQDRVDRVGAGLFGIGDFVNNCQDPPLLVGYGGLRLDTVRHEVSVGNQVLELTHLEFDLLTTLLLNAGRALTRERLLEQVWGYDFSGDTRAVDSAIKRLRAALRTANPEADGIEAIRGVGYKYKGVKV